ncbi:PREDICTED: apolipoprotein D-like [Ceratosolen solmsi marchali]|uniref:Apolipoprotein D-like n=1 Tax=Ceratosolen solmsi marchali TaxID=326594 RepID=A0AAJ6YSR5_9HYME|nr:PREDICTED: apolipoprotein D-like [Ceratosolen solmsi marchali]
MRSLTLYIVLAGCIALAMTHSYHLGTCPIVEPMSGFQMNKFLGEWYVIQKTSTASKCISYNYTRGEEPGEYIITQDSDIPILGLTSLKHEYHYTGTLTVPYPSVPAHMSVRFPLSVAGTALHVIFGTDYDNYAGIFTCQKLAFAHRQSATILSRKRDLDKAYVDNIRQTLASFGVDPFELSIISQSNCPRGNNSFDFNIDPHTFTVDNFGHAMRKAGEKIGDGVEWIGGQSSKVYYKITSGEIKKAEKPELPTNVTPLLKTPKFENNEIESIF